jgi:hypothetical protein
MDKKYPLWRVSRTLPGALEKSGAFLLYGDKLKVGREWGEITLY